MSMGRYCFNNISSRESTRFALLLVLVSIVLDEHASQEEMNCYEASGNSVNWLGGEPQEETPLRATP